MQNIGKTIADQFKSYATGWAGYSAFGSFVLYLLGYLVTRFELTLPGPAWLQAVLLDDQDQIASLFFAGLVGATAITGACLIAGNKRSPEPEQRGWFAQLLALLLALQALLLPINYSILIAHKSFP